MDRKLKSPLLPLAWGFLALFPLPLVAMIYAEKELERYIEYCMAFVLLLASGALFWGARTKGDVNPGDDGE